MSSRDSRENKWRKHRFLAWLLGFLKHSVHSATRIRLIAEARAIRKAALWTNFLPGFFSDLEALIDSMSLVTVRFIEGGSCKGRIWANNNTLEFTAAVGGEGVVGSLVAGASLWHNTRGSCSIERRMGLLHYTVVSQNEPVSLHDQHSSRKNRTAKEFSPDHE